MQFSFRELVTRNEFLVFVTIIVLSVIIGSINENYYSLANLFRLLRSATVPGIFALGVLIVLISGGIDVSFPAIGVFSLYSTVQIMNSLEIQAWLLERMNEGPAHFTAVIIAMVIGGGIGILLGLVNAVFIGLFKLPTLIVTLGTLNMFRGFLLFFIGSVIVRNIPQGMTEVARTNIISIRPEQGLPANLNVSILVLLFFVIVVSFILSFTMLGRGIYAMGGDREAAERAGFNIRRIQFFIYSFVGMLSGIAGIMSGSLSRQADPFSIVGTELEVLAAVVLGGASITGGRGTVLGTLLGVLLITIVSNSLVLVGVPTDWQRVAVGVLILIGVAIPAIQSQRAASVHASVST